MTVDYQLDQARTFWERARKVMPGGVNASARMNNALGHPMFFTRGEGAYLFDVDGHRYIDYCISHGASLLGHGHPAITSAVQKVLAVGGLLACEMELQVLVAERLLRLFPGMDMVRYACSGTETTWHALRIARAFTGKYGVVKFEGHYHGVNDTVGYSHWPDLKQAGPPDHPLPVPDSAGIPPANRELITILPFNDADAFARCLHSKGDSLAAVIMEPVNYDSCGLMPTPEFMNVVRSLTHDMGIVLIFDEVLSGFRVRPGGALGESVIPDMTVLGKAVGGGMPISAFMGRRDIMEMCTPVGPALHSGTYNAPPVLVAAIGALLDEVTKPDFFIHMNALGSRLYAGMRDIISKRGVKAWVQGVGSRFGLLFGVGEEPRNYRDVARQDMDMMRRFHLACLKRGVYLHYISPHHGYSSAHTLTDIDETLDVMDAAIAEIAH
jgi:glutamate-1-semialdehyde 2,1-aminomutase